MRTTSKEPTHYVKFRKPPCGICFYSIARGLSYHGDANGYYHYRCEYRQRRGMTIKLNPHRPKTKKTTRSTVRETRQLTLGFTVEQIPYAPVTALTVVE